MNVFFSGIIFEPPINFDNAIENTLTYGLNLVGDRTPVITGLLKDSLDLTATSIFDDAYYAWFVEGGTINFAGREMMTNSVDQIESVFIDEVIQILSY